MASSRQLALSALLLLASPAKAAQWTVTSYYVVKPTISVWTAFTETYTDTETYGLKDGVTPTYNEARSTETSSNTYDDLEIVQVYLNDDDVKEKDIMTTTTYEYSYGDYTQYVQPIKYTAPSSCPTPFTVATYTNVRIPTEVADQVSPTEVSTHVGTYVDGDKYTQITAYLKPDVASVTVDTTSDWVYTYYVQDCRNPTASGSDYFGPNSGGDTKYGGGGGSSSGWNYCMGDSYCSGLAIYAIVIAALIPAIFLLGFFESYFWFRRMMIGKFSLRFGTCLWIFLFLPVLCFTRQCPARDPQTQQALRQQWKNVGFGKAIGLWFRWGFRHRYPVELLGTHPLYHNPAPGQQGQMPPGPPPPGGYVYYAPGPPQDGQPAFQPGPQGPPPEGFKGAPDMQQQQMGAPPPGMVMYYPQYPQQAYAPPQQQQQQYPQQFQQQPQQQPMATGPISPQVSSPASDAPQPTVSPQPSSPPQELSSQPPPPGPSEAPAGTHGSHPNN